MPQPANRPPSYSKRFTEANKGRWFPLPRWWAKNLYSADLAPFLRLYLYIWSETIGAPGYQGKLELESVSTRDLASATATDFYFVSRYLYLMHAQQLIEYTPGRGPFKGSLKVNFERFTDVVLLADFADAIALALIEEGSQRRQQNRGRATHEHFHEWFALKFTQIQERRERNRKRSAARSANASAG